MRNVSDKGCSGNKITHFVFSKFYLKCLLTSRLTFFRISTLLWLGSCIHRILARFLWAKKPKHSSSNHGLFCFNSCRPTLSFAGHVARMGEERGVYRVLLGKPEGRRPLGRPRFRWVDNIRMDLQEVGCGYMDWIGLAQDRDRWRTLVSAVMNLRVPWIAGNFLTSCKPVSFSRRTLHHGVSK